MSNDENGARPEGGAADEPVIFTNATYARDKAATPCECAVCRACRVEVANGYFDFFQHVGAIAEATGKPEAFVEAMLVPQLDAFTDSDTAERLPDPSVWPFCKMPEVHAETLLTMADHAFGPNGTEQKVAELDEACERAGLAPGVLDAMLAARVGLATAAERAAIAASGFGDALNTVAASAKGLSNAMADYSGPMAVLDSYAGTGAPPGFFGESPESPENVLLVTKRHLGPEVDHKGRETGRQRYEVATAQNHRRQLERTSIGKAEHRLGRRVTKRERKEILAEVAVMVAEGVRAEQAGGA